MSDRQRHREVLGTTTLPCPYCQGGPMMITRTERVRRFVDRANPRFDPDVLHHEVCAACNATFLVSEDRIRDVLRARTTGIPALSAVGAPSHDLDDDHDEHLFLEAAAAARAAEQAEVRAAEQAEARAAAAAVAEEAEAAARAESVAAARAQAEASARAEEAERVRRRDEARARARTSAVERRSAEAAAKERARAEQRARKAAEADAREQARAQARASKLAELRARERASAEERARRRADAESRRLAAEQARVVAAAAARTPAEAAATVEPQPTADLSSAAAVRTTSPWGQAEITGPAPDPAPGWTGPSSSVLVGRTTKVGAGRRSGPVRRPPAGRTS